MIFNTIETNDLIYEGIATQVLSSPLSIPIPKQTTWFTKGLRHHWRVRMSSPYPRNKRPDLRRDCDAFVPVYPVKHLLTKQTTWFTKGLRHGLNSVLIQSHWNKRPNLRRDCDPYCSVIWATRNAWNKRPDLRRDCDGLSNDGLSPQPGNKRPDLRRDCDAD